MTIYEVNLTINADIADDYAAWLGDYIRQILAIDGFTDATWFEVEGAEPGTVQWTVHYQLRDRSSLERYFAAHAERMRADGIARFGGRFTATRKEREAVSRTSVSAPAQLSLSQPMHRPGCGRGRRREGTGWT